MSDRAQRAEADEEAAQTMAVAAASAVVVTVVAATETGMWPAVVTTTLATVGMTARRQRL